MHGLKSQEVVYNTLLPIAEQRCIERDLRNLGHPVPYHVCPSKKALTTLNLIVISLANSVQADCIQWIMETSPRTAPWSPQRIVFELMAIWFGSVHAVSTVRIAISSCSSWDILLT